MSEIQSDEEIWVDAAGWKGLYEVSNLGRLRSVSRIGETTFGIRLYGGKSVTPIKRKINKYLVVNLTCSGRRKQVLLHRLVLESFSGTCPDGMEACHNNGDRQDPRLNNLRWDTRKNNHADKKSHGTWQGGEKNPASKLNSLQVEEIRSSDESIADLAKRLGVSNGCVEKAKYKSTWRHI